VRRRPSPHPRILALRVRRAASGGEAGGGGGQAPRRRRRGEAEAAAAEQGEPAVAVAAGPVAEAGDHQAARLHAGRAQGRHQELLRRQLPRRGRLRPRLQGLRRRPPPPGPPRDPARRRQVPRPRERRRPGAPRVAGNSLSLLCQFNLNLNLPLNFSSEKVKET